MESCGEAAGLYAVAYQLAAEHGFLDHWRSRSRWSLPFLCNWARRSALPSNSGVLFLVGYCDELLEDGSRCQKWFHFAAGVRDLPTQCRMPELMEYERELFPELCEQ